MKRRDAKAYLDLLLSLLPKGKAWNRESDSNLYNFLYGNADELSRIDGRINDLLIERDTRTTTDLITNHETDLGLPDECSEENLILIQRRNIAHARFVDLGKLTSTWFIEFAELLGYTITINEYAPAWAGVMVAGDTCGDLFILHRWLVYVDHDSPNIKVLKCSFRKFKPGHTLVFFRFSGAGFSRGFSRGFNAIKTGIEGGFSKGFSIGFSTYGDGNDELLEGGFGKGFSLGFNRYNGGGFSSGFSNAFQRFGG